MFFFFAQKFHLADASSQWDPMRTIQIKRKIAKKYANEKNSIYVPSKNKTIQN